MLSRDATLLSSGSLFSLAKVLPDRLDAQVKPLGIGFSEGRLGRVIALFRLPRVHYLIATIAGAAALIMSGVRSMPGQILTSLTRTYRCPRVAACFA